MAYQPSTTINVNAASHDAFNRMRVSQATTIFENMPQYLDNPLLYESITNGGAVAHQPGKVSVQLSTGGTTAGNYAIRSSKVYHRYQPGKSQLALLTFTMSAAQTNAIARIGYYDFADGFFLERDGTTVNFVKRSSTATDLVTNGQFATNTTGWTASGSTLSRTTTFGVGELTVTNSGAAKGYAYQAITTEVGKRYVLSTIARCGTATKVGIGAGTTATGMEFGSRDSTNTGDTATRQGDTLSLIFTASGTTTYVTLYNNDTTSAHTGVFDNVSVAAVDTVVAQASWNLDKFDGNGPSGINGLDLTKAQILVIDFQYLGVGRCRMGFDINGVVYYAHQFVWANASTGVYMGSAGSLPVRAEVVNSGTAGGTVTLDWHCASVMSEGGFETPSGFQFSVDNGISGSGSINAERTIIGLRPGASLNGLTFRGQLRPVAVDVTVATSPIFWELQISPVAVLTWTAYNAAYSGAEYTATVAAVSTAGVAIDSGYCINNSGVRGTQTSQNFILMPLVNSGLKNVQDSLVLVATPLSGNAAVNASITWQEVY